jgi:hypothetical protein
MRSCFTASLRMIGPDPDHLEAALDRVMEELVRLGVEDPAIGGKLSSGEVEISITVEAESYEQAVSKAMGTIRTAIHAAEVSTPGWPRLRRGRPTEPLRVDWEKLTLVPA